MFHIKYEVSHFYTESLVTCVQGSFLSFSNLVESNDWFQQCTIKTNKTNISDIKY